MMLEIPTNLGDDMSEVKQVADLIRPLPLKVCSTTKELYGYARPVLDTDRAYQRIRSLGYARPDFVDAVLEELEERIASEMT